MKAPVEYIGARARLFKGDTMCTESPWRYNATRTDYFTAAVVGDCGAGNYTSWGVTRALTRDGYHSYYTFETVPIPD